MTWNRRRFLIAGTLAAAGTALPRGFAFGQQAPAGLRELRGGTGLFTARGGTIGWLVTPDALVVVDTQFPDTAATCLEGLRARSSRILDALINTHHHGDHTGGNGTFRPVAARIVAHANCPKLQRRAAEQAGREAEQVYADETFEETWSLDLGSETVTAKHYGPAHTGGDAVVRFENANVVHMGDLIFNRWYPFIDRPAGASIANWAVTLEQVAAENPEDTLYLFGHGSERFGIPGSRTDLLYQRDFLSALLDQVRQGIAAGRSRDEIVNLETLPPFPDHVSAGGRLSLSANLGVAYEELTAE
jgi:cyclase